MDVFKWRLRLNKTTKGKTKYMSILFIIWWAIMLYLITIGQKIEPPSPFVWTAFLNVTIVTWLYNILMKWPRDIIIWCEARNVSLKISFFRLFSGLFLSIYLAYVYITQYNWPYWQLTKNQIQISKLIKLILNFLFVKFYDPGSFTLAVIVKTPTST